MPHHNTLIKVGNDLAVHDGRVTSFNNEIGFVGFLMEVSITKVLSLSYSVIF